MKLTAGWQQTVAGDYRRPLRLVAFYAGAPSGARRRRKASGYAVMGWTKTQHFSEARLPEAGSFLFPGIHAARLAALRYLAEGAHQVSVRTNQDRELYRFRAALQEG